MSSPIQLISLDLMPGWRPYVEAMSMDFGEWDIEAASAGGVTLKEKLAEINRGRGNFPSDGVTYIVISYVMIYVSTASVCEMFRELLDDGHVYCILVSERGEQTKSLSMMEAKGVQVHRLIDQSNGLDERQSMWLSKKTQLSEPEVKFPVIFPNIPFEDNKRKKMMKKY